jgi:2-dehydropantoate 2-reductase
MDEPDARLLIVGTGAMACLFAARFAQAEIPFAISGTWPAGLDALRKGGVHLVSPDGSEKVYPVHLANHPQDCASARYALVLVKSWQTERVARQLAECLAADGLALTLQNGLGNYETLSQALGAQRVALGVTTAGAHLLGPGRVRPAGEGIITLGVHPRQAPLADLFVKAGFIVESVADARALLWGKLVINAAINPLTAILGVPNGELVTRGAARSLLACAAQEAAAVAAAQGIHLPFSDPAAATEAIARRTATNRSSMLQDIERGAPTEVDAICGAIVRAGEITCVPTPVNRTLWQLIKARTETPSTG